MALLGILVAGSVNYAQPTATVEDFETGDFSKLPWRATYWRVTSEKAHSGNYSAAAYSRSTGVLEVTLNTGAGQISFWRYSDDNGWLEFYIDGELVGYWNSMPSTWIQESFPVLAGTHTFRWEASSSDYNDNDVYIDDIAFPGVGQIIFEDDFETCDFSRLPWQTNAGIDTSEYHSGGCAVELYPGEYLEITYTVPDGTISFYRNVDAGEGTLIFFIDGREVARWSGEPGEGENVFVQESFLVAAGTHTFRWEGRVDCCPEIDDIVYYTGAGIGGPVVILVWESRFPYDSSNRVINFVQLVPRAGRCAVLDNVDIFNGTGYSADNFEVVLDGSYTLVDYYTDPRYPADFDVQEDGGVTIFRWRFWREVPFGSFAHLGLWVAECDLRIKAMLWTKDERIIGKLPASSVRAGPTGQVEVVNNLDERIEIADVEFVQVKIPIPLPALNAQQLPPQLQQQGVNLQPAPNLPPVVPINPGMAAPLPGVKAPGGVGPGGCPPEPNDDFKTASPITLPFFARCEINPDGENDFFMFRLDDFHLVSIDVDAERIGSKLDAILILWDERGRDIAYNDDYDGSDPFLSLGLAPGIYYIQVAPYGGHGAGPYELRVKVEK
jgi:hypothetical protein